MFKLIKKLIRATAATAAIEMGLALPVMMLLVTGGFEMTRYIIIEQKISKTASTMPNLVSMLTSINESQMTAIWSAVPHLMDPYNNTADFTVIISSVTYDGTNKVISWQRSGGGTLAATSKIGTAGGTPTLPSSFTMYANDNVIIGEVFYNYKPLIAPKIVGAQTIYMVQYYKPRLGSLDVINP